MPEIDVSQGVMKRILSFERRRVALWLLFFFSVAFFLFSLIILYGRASWQAIAERQSLELLQIFRQDQEVIADLWQDVLLTFWQELPQHKLAAAFFSLSLLISFVALTRRRLKIILRKLRELRSSRSKPSPKL